MNTSTRICNRHCFTNTEGQILYAGEVPSKHLPSQLTQLLVSKKKKPPREHTAVDKTSTVQDKATNTGPDFCTMMSILQTKVEILSKELHEA